MVSYINFPFYSLDFKTSENALTVVVGQDIKEISDL